MPSFFAMDIENSALCRRTTKLTCPGRSGGYASGKAYMRPGSGAAPGSALDDLSQGLAGVLVRLVAEGRLQVREQPGDDLGVVPDCHGHGPANLRLRVAEVRVQQVELPPHGLPGRRHVLV